MVMNMARARMLFWVEAVLQNDEVSSDIELKELFMKEGKLKEAEAQFYISQRTALLAYWKRTLEIYKKGK